MSTLLKRHEKLVVWIVAGTALFQAIIVGASVAYSGVSDSRSRSVPERSNSATLTSAPEHNPLATTRFWSVVLGVPLLTPLAAATISFFRRSGWRLLSPRHDFAGTWTFTDTLLIRRPNAITIEEEEISGTMTVNQNVFGIELTFDMGEVNGPRNLTSSQLAAQLSEDGRSIYMLHDVTAGPAMKLQLKRDGWCAEQIRRIPMASAHQAVEDLLGRPLKLRGDFADTTEFDRPHVSGFCVYERVVTRPYAAWLPLTLRRLLANIGDWLD